MNKQPKPKKCEMCPNYFVPQSSFQKTCSNYQCALNHVRLQKEKKAEKEWRKEKKILKNELKTLSEWKSDLQKEINKIIRILDKNWPCISSGRTTGQIQAGHLLSTAAFPALRFNLFNIYGQSAMDNNHKSGNPLEYQIRLIELFGQEHYDMIMSLKGEYPLLKLSIDEIKEKIPICRGIIKWLDLQDRQFTLEERISLRKEFNEKIGIYV